MEIMDTTNSYLYQTVLYYMMLEYFNVLDNFTSICNCSINSESNKRCIVESLCVIMELGMTCKEVENSKLNINPIIVPGGILDTKGFC